MDSKERIRCTLSHRQPDKPAVDFGATPVSGMHVSMVYKLRQHYGLDAPGTPVKVIEPYQMLGEIKDDLKRVIGIDCITLAGKGTMFGFKNENWKEWGFNDGTPVLVPGLFNTEENEDGSIYQYVDGDRDLSPNGKMPRAGFFFDAIVRQKKIEEEKLDPEDNFEEFSLISESDLNYLKGRAEKLSKETDYAIVCTASSSSFGDIALVPGLSLKEPRGIREIEEWYISLLTRKSYVKKVFEGQCEIAIENYRRINDAIGKLIDVFFVSGTDLGTQHATFISPDTFRELFKPFYKKVNDWIHDNTGWKSFCHTCGSVYALLPDLIDSGFDILNPVQIAASGMEPGRLKKEFGKYLAFWGGGVDTQKTLPLKKPGDIREEVKRMIEIFNADGGFVFNGIHNIQANVPIENMVAVIDTIQEFRR